MNRQIGIHPALMVATFLDPRFNKLGTLQGLGSTSEDEDRKAIHGHVLMLMMEVEEKFREDAPSMEEQIDQAMQDADDDEEDDDNDGFGILARMQEQEQAASQESVNLAPGAESVHDKCKAELTKYLNTEQMTIGTKDTKTKKVVNSNPLDWWKMHEGKFPTLEVLAKKFLAIQASSAPSERIFSQASLLMSAKRTRLNPKIAGKALFVKQNWQHFENRVDYLKLLGGKDAEKFIKEMEDFVEKEIEDDED